MPNSGACSLAVSCDGCVFLRVGAEQAQLLGGAAAHPATPGHAAGNQNLKLGAHLRGIHAVKVLPGDAALAARHVTAHNEVSAAC